MTKKKIQNRSFSHRVSVVHVQYHQKYYYNFVSQGLQSKMYIISLQLPPDPQLRFLYYYCCYGWMGSRGVKAKRAPLTSLASSLGTCLSWQMGGSCSDLFSVIVQAALMGGGARGSRGYYLNVPVVVASMTNTTNGGCPARSGDDEAVARRHLRRLPSGSRPLTSFRVKD